MKNKSWDDLIAYFLLVFGCYCLSLPGIYASAQELMSVWQWMEPKVFAEIVGAVMGMAIACCLYWLVFGVRD